MQEQLQACREKDPTLPKNQEIYSFQLLPTDFHDWTHVEIHGAVPSGSFPNQQWDECHRAFILTKAEAEAYKYYGVEFDGEEQLTQPKLTGFDLVGEGQLPEPRLALFTVSDVLGSGLTDRVGSVLTDMPDILIVKIDVLPIPYPAIGMTFCYRDTEEQYQLCDFGVSEKTGEKNSARLSKIPIANRVNILFTHGVFNI